MAVGALLTGCGGGDSSSNSQSSSATKQYGRQTQLSISDGELATLQNVKYASNKGVGMRTPSNFEK
ncbi:hypothetical protein C9J01_05145 [Photobacterium rosenbergii]|uniref:Uncharacterized protein n=2 Tax=Photobacterium rosenbergii TaxID=294936 RepID=A0A2T3NLI7_9GAMM|nr:hypothetical protein C9J01_05145 [Photobacterium rosenbergii]